MESDVIKVVPQQSGDQQGWASLADEYREDLLRAARARLANWHEAEDVVHDVLLRVVKQGRNVGDVDHPVAYLYRAVANECVSHWRRTRREITVEDPAEVTTEYTTVDSFEKSLMRISLRDALGKLTERQQAVVMWTFCDGYRDAEIAAKLNIKPVTVRTIRLRALARLRDTSKSALC